MAFLYVFLILTLISVTPLKVGVDISADLNRNIFLAQVKLFGVRIFKLKRRIEFTNTTALIMKKRRAEKHNNSAKKQKTDIIKAILRAINIKNVIINIRFGDGGAADITALTVGAAASVLSQTAYAFGAENVVMNAVPDYDGDKTNFAVSAVFTFGLLSLAINSIKYKTE